MPADAKIIATYARGRNPDIRFSHTNGPPGAANFMPCLGNFGVMATTPLSPDPGAPQAQPQLATSLSTFVERYRRDGDLGALMDDLKALARRSPTDPAALKAAVTPYQQMPEVVIPIYESIVAASPADAQAMVILANAYWLTGRGPDVVGDLATRAIAVDQHNRGAWHLWSLAEPSARGRMERWAEVAKRFPSDQLARAALADNATSVAHDEHDPLALDLAIATYEGLLSESSHATQRLALEETIKTLKKWRV